MRAVFEALNAVCVFVLVIENPLLSQTSSQPCLPLFSLIYYLSYSAVSKQVREMPLWKEGLTQQP